MKIITLTLNPAFDIHCFAEAFKPYGESVVDIISKDAGGKGVNISRALTENGTESRAVLIVGDANGEEFLSMLKSDGLTTEAVFVNGRIRENITLHEKDKPETRISFRGFSCEKEILSKIKEVIGEVDGNTVITMTGSLPVGITGADVLALLRELKEKGAKVVIDSKSITLADLIGFKPWLIKPNHDEAEGYTGKRIGSYEDALEIAKELHLSGISNVIISLGGEGAVLSSDEGEFYVKAPRIEAISTIGAGDSMIAGFIQGEAEGETAEEKLKRAVAFGSAACLTEGTKPPRREDVERMKN